MQDELADLQDPDRVRPGGVLDRVPGWLILAIFFAIVAAVAILITWQ